MTLAAGRNTVASGELLPFDLALAVTAPKKVKLSKTLAYAFTVNNRSTSTAPGVVVTGTLAEGAAYTRVPGYCGVSGQTLTGGLETLKGKKEQAFTVKAKPGAKGRLVFNASVAGNVADPNPGNNGAPVSTNAK